MAWRTYYNVGTKEFNTLAAAKKYAQEWANDDDREVGVTISKQRIAGAKGRLLGFSVNDYNERTIYMKPKKTKRTSNPISKLTGEWIPAHAVRQNADGTVDILREKNSGRRANISEGFMAGGVFHPIRHSYDYDSSRAGEGRGKKPEANKRKKRVAKPAGHKTYAQAKKKFGKKFPFELHHKERGFVKGFATAAARDAEYKRRNGAKNGYRKK